MSVAMVCRKAFRYGGRTLKPGDSFAVLERHVRLLRAAGAAELEGAGSPPPDDPALYETRVMEARITHGGERRRGRPRKG